MAFKAVVILATVGLGIYLWYNLWNKIIHDYLREARMGDDERLAQVQHENSREYGAAVKLAVWTVGMCVGVGVWWGIFYGVARAIDMAAR